MFVLGLYLVLWYIAPEKTIVAIRSSIGLFSDLLLPLCLVFLLMIGLNVFLEPPHTTKFLGKEPTIKMKLLAALAGIISAGPIYAWYPMLKDLRQRGAEHSLIAIFLVNRAVKPFLLPVMISFFGWFYVLALTVLTVAGSFLVGALVGRLCDSSQAVQESDYQCRTG
ncbi:MAG: permease [Deltaproteobacteria bacterium]|nr:permease [Deltaproteobacteria bacterium]